MPSKKTSYYTKADLIDFGKFLLSDDRRAKKQKESIKSAQMGTIDPLPWSVAVRILTEEDFKEWKEKRNS